MCASYEIDEILEFALERFGLTVPPERKREWFMHRAVWPTDKVPVIGTDGNVELLGWGLDVPWQTKPIINARVETAESKPTFRPIRDQRVLVPASAYFEWRKDGSRKIKTRIALAESPAFVMAGLRTEERFTILTCAPAQPIAHIHNRMPVILTDDAGKDWLNPDYGFSDLKEALVPYPNGFETTELASPPKLQGDLFG